MTHAADSGDPMSVQFKTRASFEPRAYRWDFGDGETSPVATPVHTYASPVATPNFSQVTTTTIALMRKRASVSQ